MSVTLKTVRLTAADVRNLGCDAGRLQPDLEDLELAIARAGCALMDREKKSKTQQSLKFQV